MISLRTYLIFGIQAADPLMLAGKAGDIADALLKQHKMHLEMEFSLACRKDAIKDCIDALEDMYQKEIT